jgi:hypothetical protein
LKIAEAQLRFLDLFQLDYITNELKILSVMILPLPEELQKNTLDID